MYSNHTLSTLSHHMHLFGLDTFIVVLGSRICLIFYHSMFCDHMWIVISWFIVMFASIYHVAGVLVLKQVQKCKSLYFYLKVSWQSSNSGKLCMLFRLIKINYEFSFVTKLYCSLSVSPSIVNHCSLCYSSSCIVLIDWIFLYPDWLDSQHANVTV